MPKQPAAAASKSKARKVTPSDKIPRTPRQKKALASAPRRSAPVQRAAVSIEELVAAGAGDIPSLRKIAKSMQTIEKAEAEIVESVTRAREKGTSWAVIAQALGTSRQNAQQRFGR
ncbi:MAG: hypothetical protein AB7V43_06540 [Acidimicrobiia bacterium]